MTLHEAIGVKIDIDVKTGRELTHSEIYGRAIEYLGGLEIVAQYVPYPIETIRERLKQDCYLNNTQLSIWDAAAGFRCDGPRCLFIGGGIWTLYSSHGITSASCSDGVCILKEAARRLAQSEVVAP